VVTARAIRRRDEPIAFLGDRTLFGDLEENAAFAVAFTEALMSLRAIGARATVSQYA